MKRKNFYLVSVLAIAVFVAGLFVFFPNEKDSSVEENESIDIKSLVKEFSEGTHTDQFAQIFPNQLTVKNSDESIENYDLSEKDFFVSIAPYVNETHPCTYHVLTGCQGELAEEEFEVYIEDNDGNIVVDETMTSFANGFIDLWLERDNTYNITIVYGEKKVESEFSTFENDITCITTMQLS